MATLQDVARLVEGLPEVTLGERYHHRTWLVSGKGFAWERPFSKADLKRFGDETPPGGPILAVSVADLSDKEAVLAAHPDALFTIAHFQGYPAVLVKLDDIAEAELREVLVDAWLTCAPERLARQFLAG